MIHSSFSLDTGKEFHIVKIKGDLIPNYYLITFPKHQGEPTEVEVAQMLLIGVREAKKLALQYTNDAEAYTMIYSGYSARREKGWHVHIMLLGNRWRKAWLYFILMTKNLLQALCLRKDDACKNKR
jgi:hypothetical protein